jgi:hypothetical protein
LTATFWAKRQSNVSRASIAGFIATQATIDSAAKPIRTASHGLSTIEEVTAADAASGAGSWIASPPASDSAIEIAAGATSGLADE